MKLADALLIRAAKIGELFAGRQLIQTSMTYLGVQRSGVAATPGDHSREVAGAQPGRKPAAALCNLLDRQQRFTPAVPVGLYWSTNSQFYENLGLYSSVGATLSF